MFRRGEILVWLYDMLVMLQSVIEERQSCLMHHSTWNMTPPV